MWAAHRVGTAEALPLPCTQIDADGRRRRRCRVPDRPRPVLGKRGFVKVLGASDADAMRNFGPYHRHVEDTPAHGRLLGGPDTFLDARKPAMAFVREMGWDPNRGAAEVGEDEAEVRRIVVDRILDDDAPDRDTGTPRPEGMSDHDVLVTTLLQGAGGVTMVPAVSEAFGLYLRRKANPDPWKRRKRVERRRRAERHAVLAFGGDVRLDDIRRTPHADAPSPDERPSTDPAWSGPGADGLASIGSVRPGGLAHGGGPAHRRCCRTLASGVAAPSPDIATPRG